MGRAVKKRCGNGENTIVGEKCRAYICVELMAGSFHLLTMWDEDGQKDKKKEKLTKEQAFQKLKHFCAYQERCHSEVKEKLFGYGLRANEVDELISTLITENYLNEERFAIQFAGGRYRLKKWGRNKIRYELKSRQVSEYCIRKALKEIPEDEYYETLLKLAHKRWEELKREKNRFTKLKKARDFLLQKGYEQALVQDALKQVEESL